MSYYPPDLAQVKELEVDFGNFRVKLDHKFNADGARSGKRRCSEDLLR